MKRSEAFDSKMKVALQSVRERKALEAAMQSITDRRIQTQNAAEGIWTSEDKTNAPIRREFPTADGPPVQRIE